MVCSLYWWGCVLNQVYTLHTADVWDDSQLEIEMLGIDLSLRALMFGSLNNLLLFLGKQMALLIMHSDKASLQMYPKIHWSDSDQDFLE